MDILAQLTPKKWSPEQINIGVLLCRYTRKAERTWVQKKFPIRVGSSVQTARKHSGLNGARYTNSYFEYVVRMWEIFDLFCPLVIAISVVRFIAVIVFRSNNSLTSFVSWILNPSFNYFQMHKRKNYVMLCYLNTCWFLDVYYCSKCSPVHIVQYTETPISVYD